MNDRRSAVGQLELSLPKDIDAGSHRCKKCDRVTEWVWSRGKRYQRCSVCGGRFPCGAADCGHQDCLASRAAFARGAER